MATIPYPLPNAEELTVLFHSSKVFTKMILRQGYIQVPLHPNSCNLTHQEVFCFQKIMVSVFTGIPGVAIYLDDIMVHGSTPNVHGECLHSVILALAKHYLTLNGEKYMFSTSTIDF